MCDRVECVVDETVRGMGAKMDVFLEDENGEAVDVVRREMLEPLGERNHPFAREKVEEKFMGLMSPVYGEEKSRSIMRRTTDLGGISSAQPVAEMLDLLGKPSH